MDDEMLLALKKNGGVIQMVGFSSYIKTPKPDSPERVEALANLRKMFNLPDPAAAGGGRGAGAGAAAGAGGGGGRGNADPLAGLSPEQRISYDKELAYVNSKFPADPRATVADFVDHIDYAVKLIGIDHVGISSDFDGGGGLVGWSDASETFNVTYELVRRGYTEEEIGKLWSGNLLRVMDDVQKVAQRLQAAKK
jgi:membrane dipeptidase